MGSYSVCDEYKMILKSKDCIFCLPQSPFLENQRRHSISAIHKAECAHELLKQHAYISLPYYFVCFYLKGLCQDILIFTILLANPDPKYVEL
jgi:hypothetical protein